MSWIYLSHILADSTPLYGGKGHVRVTRSRSMAAGESSNNSELEFPAHAGTHIDAPRHFITDGATLDRYPPEYWVATKPWLLDVPCEPEALLDLARLRDAMQNVPADCDSLFMRTGAERWRSEDSETYAMRGPGIAPDIADWLRRERQLRFLGIDFISISSFAHRGIGQQAHRVFLGPHSTGSEPILLIEDMALSQLDRQPAAVHIVPLRFEAADGAPVTVLARV